MSVTDDIVESILAWCKRYEHEEFSHEVIKEDYLVGYEDELIDEIETKLKMKGIKIQ